MKEYLLDEAAVFAATDHYDIIWNTTEKGLAYVECGGKKFYDHANGNVKSEETVHKVSVPKNVLDEAKEYTINFREVFERKPYFPTSSEDLFSKTYAFRPVTEKKTTTSISFRTLTTIRNMLQTQHLIMQTSSTFLFSEATFPTRVIILKV